MPHIARMDSIPLRARRQNLHNRPGVSRVSSTYRYLQAGKIGRSSLLRPGKLDAQSRSRSHQPDIVCLSSSIIRTRQIRFGAERSRCVNACRELSNHCMRLKIIFGFLCVDNAVVYIQRPRQHHIIAIQEYKIFTSGHGRAQVSRSGNPWLV